MVGNINQSRQILEQSCQIQAKRSQAEELCNLNLNLAKKVQVQQNIENERLAEILLSLGNTAQAQQKSEEAIQFYERAASISQKQTTHLQAQLNQLRLLVLSPSKEQSPEIVSQIASVSAKLESLPASRSSVYARINFAQTLLKLAKTGVLAKEAIAQNTCTSPDSLCNAAKVVALHIA